jgi:phage-related protein
MTPERPKPLTWVSSSKRDYLRFPEQVQDDMGYALYVVQMGERPKSAKPLKGFKGAGVLELVENYAGDTYRAVYTVRFAERVYVLHAFQKKSKKGIATPKSEIRLVEQRLRAAEDDYRQRHEAQKGQHS